MENTTESYFDAEINIKHEPEEIIIDELESVDESDNFEGKLDSESFSIKKYVHKHKYQHSQLKNYFCGKCNKGFTKKQSLSRHKKTVCEGSLPRVVMRKQFCDPCQRSVINLNYHKATFHTTPSHHCELCNFSTKYFANLEAHKNRMHVQKKSFVCNVCNREFKDQSNRNRHQRAQHTTRVKSTIKFECPICTVSNTFSRKDNLNLHLKRIHGSSNMKALLYHCDLCESSTYLTKISLLRHMRHVHLPFDRKLFTCNVCHVDFLSKETLVNHLNGIHLKKFCCRICSKVLSSKKTLAKHERKCDGKGRKLMP